MECPNCDQFVSWSFIESEEIEPNEEFECPHCGVSLMYEIDEGTYYGAQHKTLIVVDE